MFLQALGRLGYTLGVETGWDPEKADLERLELLHPDRINYRALDEEEKYNMMWVNVMMKQAKDSETDEFDRYVFNNTRENVQNTWLLLGELISIGPQEVEATAESAEALA